MKHTTDILYWLAMVGLGVYFAYTKGWIFANFESVSAKEAYRLMEEDNTITLLDVRSTAEYKEGHLPDATLIPLQVLKENLNKLNAVKDQKILLYCRSGNRSVTASRILKKNGFIPINVKGGIIALEQEGAVLVK